MHLPRKHTFFRMKKHLFFLLLALVVTTSACTQPRKVWVDADTGNEIDDLYAIAWLLKAPSVEVIALSSAHFNNPDLLVFEKWNDYDTRDINTLELSQQLNEQLLQVLGKTGIPAPKGADRQMGRAWGGEEPRDSEAVQMLIQTALALPEGEKLDVITLGAVTNVASAIAMQPAIKQKIRVFCLGGRYYQDKKAWDKNEFNVRNDLNAFDFLLNADSLDLTIMPIEAAMPLQFDRQATFERLDDRKEVERILQERWVKHAANDSRRIMWDLALAMAWARPELTRQVTIPAPAANQADSVKAFISVDEQQMKEQFWQVLQEQ